MLTCQRNHYTRKAKDLIALAHSIIAGIPDEKIDLYMFRVRQGKSKDCGTICCGAGWLAIHPKFNRKGLKADASGTPTFQGLHGYDALDRFFGNTAFNDMFAVRSWGNNDYDIFEVRGRDITDKNLLLHRMKIAYHGLEKWKELQNVG